MSADARARSIAATDSVRRHIQRTSTLSAAANVRLISRTPIICFIYRHARARFDHRRLTQQQADNQQSATVCFIARTLPPLHMRVNRYIKGANAARHIVS